MSPRRKTPALPTFEADVLISNAIKSLAGDTRFQDFIEVIRRKKDEATLLLIHDDTVKDERLTLAAIGVIRAMQDIIDQYEFLASNLRDEDNENQSQAQQMPTGT
jgi:hypothetical protein